MIIWINNLSKVKKKEICLYVKKRNKNVIYNESNFKYCLNLENIKMMHQSFSCEWLTTWNNIYKKICC